MGRGYWYDATKPQLATLTRALSLLGRAAEGWAGRTGRDAKAACERTRSNMARAHVPEYLVASVHTALQSFDYLCQHQRAHRGRLPPARLRQARHAVEVALAEYEAALRLLGASR